MTAAKLLYTTNGIDLFEKPDGSVYGYRGSKVAGASVLIDGGLLDRSHWYGWRTGEDPVHVQSRHTGIRHFVGRCPDCVCDPYACEHDDTGDSCMDCGFCLNGCSADECPMEAK